MFFFALWAKDFHTSDVNVSAVFSNLRCTWPEKVFGRKFSRKKTAFNFYSDIKHNVSRISATFFRRLAFHKIHFSFLEQNVGVKNCLKNKEFIFFTILWGRFSHFRQMGWVSFLTTALKPCQRLFSIFSSTFCGFWNFQVLNEVFLVWMEKASFYQSRFLFEDKCFFEKKLYLSFFCTLGKKLSHVGDKRSGSLLEFALYVTRKCFWRKIFLEKNCLQFFLDFEQNVSRLSAAFLDMLFTIFIFSF